MAKKKYAFTGKVWLYPGSNAAWHFTSVPKKVTEEIDAQYGKVKRGWGSLPIDVTVGKTKWKTSIFPDTKTGTYLLPLKAQVRRSEGLFEGETAQFQIEIRP